MELSTMDHFCIVYMLSGGYYMKLLAVNRCKYKAPVYHSLTEQGGITLIEVMVSVFVFVLVVLVFSGTVIASLRSSTLNGQYAQATSLCQHKIDQMRAVGFGRLNYTELSDAGIIDDHPSTQPYSFTQVDDVDAYLPDPITTLRIYEVNPSVYRVEVSISWISPNSSSRRSSTEFYALIGNAE